MSLHPHPPHRPLRRRIFAAGAAAALAAGLVACAPPPEPRHLVVVVIDTLRADHLGAYGYSRDTSPRIDALADRGMLFDDALAQSSWTVPATASLLTSLYPSQHGALVEGEVKHLGETPPNQLRVGVESLAQILEGAGMRTALLSANPYLYGRFQRGFDLAEVKRQDAGSLTDRAIVWLGGQPEVPSFVHIQYMDLHQPIDPPPPYFDMFPAASGGEREARHEEWSFAHLEADDGEDYRRFHDHKIALYDGALRYVDHQIGRLVDALDELGMLDETLLVVTSDHGEEFWDHWREGRAMGNDPRGIWGIGHGHSMFQELLHVPLIVSGPGVARGRRSDCPVRHLDVAPTALDYLGLEPRPQMRGISLVPLLAAGGGDCPELPQIAESPAYGPDSRAVVWRGRKLIERADGVRMLFDLRRDPAERQDLIGRQPAAAEALAGILARELAAAEPRPPGEPMEYDPETEAQLRALGYL